MVYIIEEYQLVFQNLKSKPSILFNVYFYVMLTSPIYEFVARKTPHGELIECSPLSVDRCLHWILEFIHKNGSEAYIVLKIRIRTDFDQVQCLMIVLSLRCLHFMNKP